MKAEKSNLSGQKDNENEIKNISDEFSMRFDNRPYDDNIQIEPDNGALTRVYQSWLELLKSPTVGPFHAFTQGYSLAFEDILKIAEKSTNLQSDINDFLVQTNKASLDAINMVYKRSPKKRYETK